MNALETTPSREPILKSSRYPRWLFLIVPVLVLLHQGSWLWSDDRLILGLPVNLFYHIVLSLVLSAIMFLVVTRAWPDDLDKE